MLSQECDDDDSGLFGFFNSFDTDDRETSVDTVGLFDDSLRAEETEWNYGLSILDQVGLSDIYPIGFEIGLKKQFPAFKRLYVGGLLSLYNYGHEVYDTLMGDYDHISTNNSLYNLDLTASYNLVKLDDFIAFLGVKIGTMFSSTFSKAIDTDCSCEQKSPKSLARIDSNIALYYGPFLGFQIPLGSFYDRLSFKLGYQMSSPITYVKKGDVEIKPNQISYFESTSTLNMLNIQIGMSHFF